MMTISSRAAVAAFASLMLMGSAFAQGTTAPATGAPAAKTEKKAEKPHTPESLECSKQADDKGLHGKERKKFRSECIKEAKAAAKK
jgi:invasion protein IalB